MLAQLPRLANVYQKHSKHINNLQGVQQSSVSSSKRPHTMAVKQWEAITDLLHRTRDGQPLNERQERLVIDKVSKLLEQPKCYSDSVWDVLLSKVILSRCPHHINA
jgi:hypothetical protein